MKGRNWILIVLLFVLVIIIASTVAIRTFHVNRIIREYINKTVSIYLGGEFDSSSIYIMPWSFGLRNAKLKLRDIPVTIEARRIRIEFSMTGLLKNIIFDPKNIRLASGARTIFFDEPKFNWILGSKRNPNKNLDFGAVPEISLQSLPSVRIHIVKGSLVFVRGESSLVFADNIGGWLDGLSASRININVQGRVLSGNVNTHFKGAIDKPNGDLSIDITGNDCDLSRKFLGILTGEITPLSGLLDFSLNLNRTNDKYKQTGNFSIENGSFIILKTGIQVNDVEIAGKIHENEVLFESVQGEVLGFQPSLTGKLSLKPAVELDLSLFAPKVSLSNVLSEIVPDREEYPEGIMNITSTISGTLTDISMQVTVRSDSIRVGKSLFTKHSAELDFSGAEVNLKKISAEYNGFNLTGIGNTNLLKELLTSSDDINAASGKFNINLVGVSGINPEKTLHVMLNGTASPGNREYTARCALSINRESVPENALDLHSLNGTFRLKNDKLHYELANDALTLDGTIDELFGDMTISSSVGISKLPVLRLFGKQDSTLVLDGNGAISGKPDSLSLSGKIGVLAGKNLNSTLTANALITNLAAENRLISVESKLIDHHLRYSHPMEWGITLRSDSKETLAEVTEPSGALLNLHALHETGALTGNLALDEFPLEWIIDIFKRESFNHRGKISGRAFIGGTVKNPNFHTPERLNVTDMNIGGLDKLVGQVNVSGSFDELVFSDADIQRKGMQILHSDSKWEKGQPYILDASGENVSLSAIDDIISESRVIDGETDYNARLVFTRRDATIDGDFKIINGHFLDIPFEEASGIFDGGSTGFIVRDFKAGVEGSYKAQGSASSGFFYRDMTEDPGLKMNLLFEGNLLRSLPHLTNSVAGASGESQLALTIGGVWPDPTVIDGELYVSGGIIKPAFLVDKITDINATLTIDSDFETITGYRAVRLRSASGTILGKRVIARNIHIGEDQWPKIERPGLLSVINHQSNLDFGIITARIDPGATQDSSLELTVPGFMKPNETGKFNISGDYGNSFLIGAADAGGSLTPYLSGNITVLSGDVNYPLLTTVSDTENAGFLEDIYWDLSIVAGSNVNYKHEENIKWRVGGTTVSRTLVKLDENSVFEVKGRLKDSSFRVEGDARAYSGAISYYGTEFDIERAEFKLDTTNITTPATLAARARTVVYDDSTGVDTEIILNVSFIDKVSGQRREATGRTDISRSDFRAAETSRTIDAGPLGNLQIEFTSTNPSDDTMSKILARLGISQDNILNAATGAFTAGVDNYYFDMWMRLFEEALRKRLKLDVVRFTPSFLGNIVRSQIGMNYNPGANREFVLFDRTRIMLGEYFLDDWFLSYRGEYGLGRDFLRRKEKGFFHEFGLQYLLNSNTRLQLNYNYDNIISKGEKRIEIRHNFEF